ncbi:transcription antitermination factor NusB [Tistrella bauzanensis]
MTPPQGAPAPGIRAPEPARSPKPIPRAGRGDGTREAGMARRTAARLAAVQALYQIDFSALKPEVVVTEFLNHRIGKVIDDGLELDADRDHFRDIVMGFAAAAAEIDPMLEASLAEGWRLERVEQTLRAILRAGAYELTARTDVPTAVIINEYVNVAHAFFAGGEPGL